MQPQMILVRPQMGENIGHAARAMANFGWHGMRLVAPRDGWPNEKAQSTASKAGPVLDAARLHETTADATSDLHFVLATTARDRTQNLPIMDARAAGIEIAKRQRAGQKCGVLFGPERTGLENDDLAHANAIVTIPLDSAYPSLNLGAAVGIVAYELAMAQNDALGQVELPDSPAEKQVLDGFLSQLEAALDAINFWRVAEKKPTMWRNIRTSIARGHWSAQEVATWRGMIRALRG
jgi:tRNA/rRNA methyltransferase